MRRIVTAREQLALLSPWRTAMAYWVADGSEPVHHIPIDEALGYRQYDPRSAPELPEKVKSRKPDDWALSGEENWHMEKPSYDDMDEDQENQRPSLRDSIGAEGVKSPVEILTDGSRAFMGDGVHRSTMAHELGHSHIPAHVIKMHPDDLDFYAQEAPMMRNQKLPAAGPGVQQAVG